MPGLQHVPGSDIAGGGNELAHQLAGDRAPAVTAGNFADPGNAIGVAVYSAAGIQTFPITAVDTIAARR
ncbi:MAG: hypothetical protein WBY44_28580 [Bryobacteraceae bacterium]|jgi:hypothetical protein